MTRPAQRPSSPDRYPVSAVIIVGPTASGKTAVAHALAARTGLPILSADSMLVYRGMDIGTAKPSPDEIRRYGYSGLDLTEPDRPFSVGAWLRAVASQLRERPVTPQIVCGGAGLYIAGLCRGIHAAAAHPEIRREAEQRLQEQGVVALQRWLRDLEPARYTALADPLNPRRLIRAIEAAHAEPTRAPHIHDPTPIRAIGLATPPKELQERIRRRIERMLREGWMEEAEKLRARVGTLSSTASLAIGYREIFEVLDGIRTVESAAEAILLRTSRYAKRQRTWFRRQFDVQWVDAGNGRTPEGIADEAMDRMTRASPEPLSGLNDLPDHDT